MPSIDLNINLMQNTLPETPRIMFDQISEHPMTESRSHLKLVLTTGNSHFVGKYTLLHFRAMMYEILSQILQIKNAFEKEGDNQ